MKVLRMPSSARKNIHRIRYTAPVRRDSDTHENRILLGKRFKTMRLSCGLDRAQAAKLLHVTERTLHNWETGVFHIPYAAYKLMRVMNCLEIPGKAFEGWRVFGGCFVTPEGHTLDPRQFNWWGNLYGRARLFSSVCAQLGEAQKLIVKLKAALPADDMRVARAAAGEARLDLSLGHFRTSEAIKPESVVSHSFLRSPCPASHRYKFLSKPSHWLRSAA